MQNENFNAYESYIVQIPTEENGLTAIVSVRKGNSELVVCDFGCSDANSSDSKDIDTILENARENALKKVEDRLQADNTFFSSNSYGKANSSSKQQEYDQKSYGKSSGAKTSGSSAPREYNHSTTNPASESQINLLTKLAKGAKSLENHSYNRFNKYPHELNSKEANDLIQEFKRQENYHR